MPKKTGTVASEGMIRKSSTTTHFTLSLMNSTDTTILLILCALLVLPPVVVVTSQASALPSIVTASGATSCANCKVAEGGTTLFVEEMMMEADGSQSTASFNAINLDFISTLTIEFPTSGSSFDWDPGVTFTVYILNGSIASASTLNMSSPFPLLRISGRARGGSTITIQGGHYPILGEDAITAFVQLATLSIYNNSRISITGATFTKWLGRQQFNSTSPTTNLISSSGDLLLGGSGASLVLSGNTVLMSDVVFVGSWTLTFFHSGPLQITGHTDTNASTSSTPTTGLEISNTVLNFTDMVVGGILGVCVSAVASIILQGPYGRFNTSKNTFVATRISAPQSLLTFTHLTSDLQLVLSDGSKMEWSLNEVLWSRSNISSALVVVQNQLAASLWITESSSIRVVDNRFVFTEMIAMWTLGMSGILVITRRDSSIGAAPIQVAFNSSIEISRTEITVDNISSTSMTTTVSVALFKSSYASVLIDDNSTIDIQSTILTVSRCNVSLQYIPFFVDSATVILLNHGALRITQNIMTMAGVEMFSWGASFLYLNRSPIFASQNSSVLVSQNGIYVYDGILTTTSQAVLVVLPGSSLTLSTQSTFAVTENAYRSSNVSGGGASFCRLLWISNVVNITGASVLQVSNTTVDISTTPSSLYLPEIGSASPVPPPTLYGVWLSDSVFLGSGTNNTVNTTTPQSTLLVSGNLINLPARSDGVLLWLESTTRYIYDDGAVDFANNSVSNIASFITISTATTTANPNNVSATTISFCRNYFNGVQCRSVVGGAPTVGSSYHRYECCGTSSTPPNSVVALPYGQVQVYDCAGLLTQTQTSSVSGNVSTISPSISGANFTILSSLTQKSARSNSSTLSRQNNTSTPDLSRTMSLRLSSHTNSRNVTSSTEVTLTATDVPTVATSTVPSPSASTTPSPTSKKPHTLTKPKSTSTLTTGTHVTSSLSLPSPSPPWTIPPMATLTASSSVFISPSYTFNSIATSQFTGTTTSSFKMTAIPSTTFVSTLSSTEVVTLSISLTATPALDSPPTSTFPPPPTPPTGKTPSVVPPSPPTITSTTTPALTPSHRNTPSNTPIQFCGFTCTSVIAAFVVSYDDINPSSSIPPAEQAVEQYYNKYLLAQNGTTLNSTTTSSHGCTPLSIPFVATNEGAVAHVLIHIDFSSSLLPNSTYPLRGHSFYSSNPGAISAVGASETILHGSIVVVDVQRVDAAPLSSTSGSISFPLTALHCVPDYQEHADGDRNIPVFGGLPYLAVNLEAPPTAIPDSEKNAIAALSGLSPTMHTIAAINLLRCSPGALDDVESEAGIRALVPIALSASCEGAVEGAFLGIGLAVVVNISMMFIYMRVQGVTWIKAAASTRCPGVILGVWSFLQMGLIICGGRLMTDEGGTHTALGAAGVIIGAVVPIICVGVVWGFVSRRSYPLLQKYQQEEEREQIEAANTMPEAGGKGPIVVLNPATKYNDASSPDASRAADADIDLQAPKNNNHGKEREGCRESSTSISGYPTAAPLVNKDITLPVVPCVTPTADQDATATESPQPNITTTSTPTTNSKVKTMKPPNFTLWIFAVFFPTSELDLEAFPSSKACSPQVAILRLPSPAWCAVFVIQPTILMLCVFASGALCSLVLIFSAIAMLAVGIVCHLMFRPQRVLLSNFVQGVAMILNSAMLIISSLLVDNPVHTRYVDASRSVAKVQLAVTILQITHELAIALYMYVIARGVLQPSLKPNFTVQGVLTSHIINSGKNGCGNRSLNYCFFRGRGERGAGSPHRVRGADEGAAFSAEVSETVRGEWVDVCEELTLQTSLLREEV